MKWTDERYEAEFGCKRGDRLKLKKDIVKKEENIFNEHDDIVFSDDERNTSKCMVPMDDDDDENDAAKISVDKKESDPDKVEEGTKDNQ